MCSPKRAMERDTTTHTNFNDRLCGVPEATSTLVREISQSLSGRAGMQSQK